MRKFILLFGIFLATFSCSATEFDFMTPKDFGLSYRKFYQYFGENMNEFYELSSPFCTSCFVSFKIKLTDANQNNKVTVSDSNDKSWKLQNESPLLFRRLKMPVDIHVQKASGESSGFLYLSFSDIVFEFDPNLPMASTFDGIFGDGGKEIHTFSRLFYGKARAQIKTKFFRNHESEFDCYRLVIISEDNQRFEITQHSLEQTIPELSLPAKLIAEPICQSSTLKKPENSAKDFEIFLQIWPLTEK